MMKIKLKVAQVFNGSVWPQGSVLEVPDVLAHKWIDAQEAEAVSAATPAPRKEKEDK